MRGGWWGRLVDWGRGDWWTEVGEIGGLGEGRLVDWGRGDW